MRLFIAVNFSEEVRNKMLRIQYRIAELDEYANLSRPENLHLTLAFLGECDSRQFAAAKRCMDAVSFEPFPLQIGTLGRFKRDGGDIWWIGCNRSPQLLQLQNSLADSLRSAGFALEQRDFKPHITLAREVFTDEKPWKIEPFGETIRSIELMKSERIRGKLTYTAVYRKNANAVCN